MRIAGMIASLWRRLAVVFFAPAPAPDPKPALKSASPTYERDRKRVWRAKKPSRQCPDVSRDRPGTVPGHVPDTLKERKKEERRERETRAHIPENWKPNEEGMRIGAEVFGAWLENKITQHRAYWRRRDPPKNVDWDAIWLAECDRCRRQLPLPFGGKPTAVTGDQNETAQARYEPARRSVAGFARQRVKQEFTRKG